MTMARFEITSGLFRPAPFRDQYARGSMLIKRLADIGKGEPLRGFEERGDKGD